ncbi:MAG: YigZ family protein [Bacteroidetes bacterium]|nr:YigZ family protein [Bacteroidota bacterium]
MCEDLFKTISEPSEGFYKDKGSKFYAFAFPVYSECEVKEIQKGLRKKYHDARHHCYAFRLGAEKKIYRASDDGEPANSSGPPILGQIQSKDLSNILIVVVRYFGGTKLGIPGLIKAYRAATLDAINNGKIISKTENIIFKIKFEYPAMNSVMRIIKEEGLDLINQKSELNCEITLSVRKKNASSIIERFKKINNLKVDSD